MNKRRIGVVVGLILVAVAVASVPVVLSQSGSGQPAIYTYVSQFQVPRANWAEYSESTQKSFVPMADKMVVDGTILAYSTFESIVHTPDGYTHGAAWTSTSIAGLLKVLEELRKGGPQSGQVAATKHEDFLMQTTMYHGSGGTPAYLRVLCSNVKPDKPGEYAAVLKKYFVSTFDEQIKQGVVTYYGLDEQYVNNAAPSMRCLVIDYPNAEGMDKWVAAITATLDKMSPADREAFNGATVPDSRRDILARITHWGHK